MSLALVFAMLFGTPLVAQQPPPMLTMTLTVEEQDATRLALQKLMITLSPHDLLAMRIKALTVSDLSVLDQRNIGLVGLALSRASVDPAACALLKRISATAVCVE
jgi:hypothetical protein